MTKRKYSFDAQKVFAKPFFALDRFHVKKKIKDSLRGTHQWKKFTKIQIWEKIKSFDYEAVRDLLVQILKGISNGPHQEILVQLLDYLTTNWKYILHWQDSDYLGCSIETYMAQYIKITFRSHSRIFNENIM